MAGKFLIASEAGIAIKTMNDVVTAIGATFGAAGLVLTEAELSPEFFNLRTGIAGELFQKFTNYQLRLLLLVPDPARYGDRFIELAREHRNHDHIRIVQSKAEAGDWLS